MGGWGVRERERERGHCRLRMGHRHVAIARRFALKCGGDGRRRPTTATTAPLLRRRPNVVVYTRRQLTFKPPIVHSFRKFQPMLLSIRFASSVSFFFFFMLLFIIIFFCCRYLHFQISEFLAYFARCGKFFGVDPAAPSSFDGVFQWTASFAF